MILFSDGRLHEWLGDRRRAAQDALDEAHDDPVHADGKPRSDCVSLGRAGAFAALVAVPRAVPVV
jgi:hypothetical protein